MVIATGSFAAPAPSEPVHRQIPFAGASTAYHLAKLGVTDIAFLHYVDGELANTLALQRDLCREIRRFKARI